MCKYCNTISRSWLKEKRKDVFSGLNKPVTVGKLSKKACFENRMVKAAVHILCNEQHITHAIQSMDGCM